MRDVTLIDPAITFLKARGGTAVLGDTDALAEWLDSLYDAILNPHRSEGASTRAARALQLHEIEQLLFRLAEETSRGAVRTTPRLRSSCEAVVGEYREGVLWPTQRGSGPCAWWRRSLISALRQSVATVPSLACTATRAEGVKYPGKASRIGSPDRACNESGIEPYRRDPRGFRGV